MVGDGIGHSVSVRRVFYRLDVLMTDAEIDLVEAALKLFQDGELYGQQTSTAKAAMRAFKNACAAVVWARTMPVIKKLPPPDEDV